MTTRTTVGWDVWRICLVGSFVACLAKISSVTPTAGVIHNGLLALQLGLLGAAAVWTFVRRGESARWPALDLTLLLVLVAVATASTLWSTDRHETLLQAAALATFALFLVGTRVFRWVDRDAVVSDLRLLYWLVVTATAAGLLLALGRVGWVFSDYNRWQGFTSNPNYAGMIAAAVLPLGYWAAVTGRLGRRGPYVASSILLLLAIGVSGSRGATAAAAIGIVVVHVLERGALRRQVTWVLLATFAVSAVLTTGAANALLSRWTADVPLSSGATTSDVVIGRIPEASADLTSGRLDIWRMFWGFARQRPLVGWGYGTSDTVAGDLGLSPHNILLLVAVELGAVGLLVFVALLVVIARRGDYRGLPWVTAAVASIAAMELTESSMLGVGGPTALLVWLTLLGWSAGLKPATDEDADVTPAMPADRSAA